MANAKPPLTVAGEALHVHQRRAPLFVAAVERMADAYPWLAGVVSVRVLLDSLFRLYAHDLKPAELAQGLLPLQDRARLRRGMIYFANTTQTLVVMGKAFSTSSLYKRARLEIASAATSVPSVRAGSLRALELTVAAIMEGVRTSRALQRANAAVTSPSADSED